MKNSKSKKKPVSAKHLQKVASSNPSLREKITGFLFLVVALSILLTPFPTAKQKDKPRSNEPISIDKKLLESKKSDNMPTQIIIPTQRIDIKVVPSKVVDGYWELSETTASYGLGSGLPGSKTNTVIFAHAREGLFYSLKDIKKEDSIYVLTKEKWHKYKVNKIISVYPDQKEVILPSKNEILTLYTCTGFNDEKRLVVIARPS